MSRERAWVAESLATEMVTRLDVMQKDVLTLTKKVCVCMCVCPFSEGGVCVCVCVG